MEKFRLWKIQYKGKHGIELQEKTEDSNSVRSVNSITNSGKITVIVKTSNLTLVKVNPKSSPPKHSCDVLIQNEKKKRRTFSANIGSLEIRTKNTFWGK